MADETANAGSMPLAGPQPPTGEAKERYIRHLFDSIAEHYDFMNMVMSLGMLRYWQRVFRNWTNLAPGGQALDVACGTAELALIMAQQVGATGSVVGVDLSPGMVAIGQRKIERLGMGNRITLSVGNALDLPHPDNSFDCVATGFAMRNVADIERAFAEMARVARPGGRVLCLELSRPVNPLFRLPYSLYFNHIVPWLGRWNERRFARQNDTQLLPYTWLPESLKHFPDQEGLAAIYRKVGLIDVTYRNLSGGAVCLHIGTKDG